MACQCCGGGGDYFRAQVHQRFRHAHHEIVNWVPNLWSRGRRSLCHRSSCSTTSTRSGQSTRIEWLRIPRDLIRRLTSRLRIVYRLFRQKVVADAINLICQWTWVILCVLYMLPVKLNVWFLYSISVWPTLTLLPDVVWLSFVVFITFTLRFSTHFTSCIHLLVSFS